MLQKDTVFVLGAGVSHEFGLPLGSTLKETIRELLPHQGAGDDSVRAAVQTKGVPEGMAASEIIRRALPFSASIDNLVEHLSGHPLARQAAKIGIVAAILNAERASALYVENDLFTNTNAVTESSLTDLFRLMVGRSSQDQVQGALRRASFIVFNYDRCLEHYLYHVLIRHSGFEPDRAKSIVQSLTILHPYGAVAPLWASSDDGRAPIRFGEKLSNVDLYKVADNILTFSEDLRSGLHQYVASVVGEAERIIFLGCAHHPQNMALLRPLGTLVRQAYGTMYMPPPVDPAGHATPSMDTFSAPSSSEIERTIRTWPRPIEGQPVESVSFQALTSRQLIAKYGASWTVNR